MASILSGLIHDIKQVWHACVRPYHLYDLILHHVYYDEKTCEEQLVFHILNLNSTLTVPLQRIGRHERLLENLPALELAVIDLLSFEAKQRQKGRSAKAGEALMTPFLDYPAIESFFYSETKNRNMLVLTLDNHEHALCLSVKALAKNAELLDALRLSQQTTSPTVFDEPRLNTGS